MKQALFILAAFLYFIPQVSRAQDFEVLGTTKGTLTVTTVGQQDRIDTSIWVKNTTNLPIVITLDLLQSIWYKDVSSTVTINSLDSVKIPLYAKFTEVYGVFRSRLIVKDGSSTITIPLIAQFYPNILEDKSSSYRDFGVPVGTSSCLPLVVSNVTTSPINIYKLSFGHAVPNNDFLIDTLIPIPYAILPGETITIAEICFVASKANLSKSENFTVYYSINGENSSSSIFAQYKSTTDSILLKPCVEPSIKSVTVGPVIYNGTIETSINLQSNRYKTQTISVITFPDDVDRVFKVKNNSLPIQIDSLSTATVIVEFTPTLLKPIVKDRFATRMWVYTDDCNIGTVDLTGIALQPTADSTSTPLFPDKEYVLGMSSSAPSFSQDFHFVNNRITNTKIVSVGLFDPSPEFVVTNITPTNTLPFTLLPGEKMTVSVLFTPSQVGKVFFNQLVITTEQGIQSISYPLQGLRTTTSGVKESSDISVSLMLSPNPATESVAVSVKGAGQVESGTMTDELGKTIFFYNQPQQPEWKWELNHERVTAGTYFIRVNGKTPEGAPFIVTKRLVVQ